MKTLAGLFLALLTVSAGCSQKDWIDRTLVTVDVTGTWYGSVRGGSFSSANFLFELEQQGATVKGSVGFSPGTRVDIEGTVAGDVFRFRNARGNVEGEMTVSGDEMSGRISGGYWGTTQFSVRRVVSSSRPSTPPR